MPTPELIKKYWIFLIFLFSGRAMSQETGAGIKEIQTSYNTIQKELKNYKTKQIDIEGQSTKGGYVKGFYKKHNLALIISEYSGEAGRVRNEYYFEKEKLIFVLEQRFNSPGADGIDIASERLYFMNGALLLWLDKDKNQVKNNQAILNNKTKRVLETVGKLKKSLDDKQAS